MSMDFSNIKQLFRDVDNEALYGLVLSILVILITISFLLILRRKRTSRRAVLITGLSEAGKTVLFSKLVSFKKVSTYTSMKENSATISPPDKSSLMLVDLPGNERLRLKLFEDFLPLSRGIIFVIDSFNFPKEIRDVASFLYALFQERLIHKNHIPFLIVCNKQDEAIAKSSKVIQSQLEKEMNALLVTQTGKLDSTSQAEETIYFGRKGKDFQFSDLKPIRVEFVDISALDPGDGGPKDILPEIWSWLSKIA